MEPPFTVLDTKTGRWQGRKKKWVQMGIKSEVGRGEALTFNIPMHGDWKNDSGGSTSVFDPALTELIYNWFAPEGGSILDPFAGGSVRGIVAAKMGHEYTGIELRPEQVASNRAQAEELLKPDERPEWIEGDAEEKMADLWPGFDFVFSCPPYANLEVYSDIPGDLSYMDYSGFCAKYSRIIKRAVELLAPGSFAVFVVGDVRDKNGYFLNFPGDTKKMFMDAGAVLYNEAVLLNSPASAAIRAKQQFKGNNRKLVKVHQNVQCFYKPKNA